MLSKAMAKYMRETVGHDETNNPKKRVGKNNIF